MSEQDSRRHLAALINAALTDRRLSRRAFARANDLNPNTLGDYLNGKRATTDANIRSITDALGWDWAKVSTLLNSTHPNTWTADQLQPDPWGEDAASPELHDVDVAALTWEITRRIHAQQAELEELRHENAALRATLTAPPTDAYGLAADLDRSGHGRHLAAEADEAGEEDQS